MINHLCGHLLVDTIYQDSMNQLQVSNWHMRHFLLKNSQHIPLLRAWKSWDSGSVSYKKGEHTQAEVFVWERCNLCLCGGRAIILWSQCDCQEPQMQISTEGLCLCNVCGRALTWVFFGEWENIQSLTFFGSLFKIPDFHSTTTGPI